LSQNLNRKKQDIYNQYFCGYTHSLQHFKLGYNGCGHVFVAGFKAHHSQDTRKIN
jgi:hypothetical protein